MAVRKQFIIPKINHEFDVVTGVVISEELSLFAHKSDSSYIGWVVSDIKSGCMLACHFKTLDACKEYVDTLPEETIEKIKKVRTNPDYLELCDTIKAKAAEGSIKNKFYEAYTFEEAFDALNENGGQVGLFDLEPPVKVLEEDFSDSLTEDLIMGWKPEDADRIFELYKSESDEEKKKYLKQTLQLCLFQIYMDNKTSDEWRHGRWKEISDELKKEKKRA